VRDTRDQTRRVARARARARFLPIVSHRGERASLGRYSKARVEGLMSELVLERAQGRGGGGGGGGGEEREAEEGRKKITLRAATRVTSETGRAE